MRCTKRTEACRSSDRLASPAIWVKVKIKVKVKVTVKVRAKVKVKARVRIRVQVTVKIRVTGSGSRSGSESGRAKARATVRGGGRGVLAARGHRAHRARIARRRAHVDYALGKPKRHRLPGKDSNARPSQHRRCGPSQHGA